MLCNCIALHGKKKKIESSQEWGQGYDSFSIQATK